MLESMNSCRVRPPRVLRKESASPKRNHVPEESPLFDLLIRNANILDGTGSPAYQGDLAVQNGRIAALGQIPPDAESASTLNAQHSTLAPGFIDIHTHADIALLARPEHLPKVMQGVTTEVFTNCGLGF